MDTICFNLQFRKEKIIDKKITYVVTKTDSCD